MSLLVRTLTSAGLLALTAASAAAQGGPCVVSDNGTGTVTLPPAGCGYVSPTDFHQIIAGLPPGTTIVVGVEHARFICGGAGQTPCEIPGGTLGGNIDMFDSTLTLRMQGTGALSGFSRQIDLPVQCEVHTAPRVPGQPVQTFATDFFSLGGGLFGDPDFELLTVTGGTMNGLPSPGSTTLTQTAGPGSDFAVDSFFDIAYKIDFVGAAGGPLSGLSGSTTDMVVMSASGPNFYPSFCDAGDGSLASCPCGNPGNPDSGCDIQQLTGGVRLNVLAQQFLPQNRATLEGVGFPVGSAPAAVVIRAPALDPGSPVLFGDGLRCVGVPLVRLGATFASGGTSIHTLGHGASAPPGQNFYQLWFRNTPAMYCTPDAFNLSNGRVMSW